jgi:hypothetical protein
LLAMEALRINQLSPFPLSHYGLRDEQCWVFGATPEF